MSRAAQRGGRHGGRTRGPNLPFEVDPELLDAVDDAGERERESDDDFRKELFPEIPNFVRASPITEEERRGVQLEREIQAKRRAGPFWTGTNQEWADIDGRSGATSSAFDRVSSYSKKRTKQPFQLASLKRVKVVYKEFMPKELYDVVAAEASVAEPPAKKRLGLAKSAVDKLTRFDEDEANVDVETAESEDELEKGDDEDDFEREPQDDDFEEEEDEADNDYNAEKYFEGGEDEFEDVEGDEYGEDGY